LFEEVIAPTVTPEGALNAVLAGAADIAPIDAYALHLLRRFRPELTDAVRSVGRTARTPIPLLVATAPPSDALRAAFLGAHLRPGSRELMQSLLLQRFVLPESASYDALKVRAEQAWRYWGSHLLAGVVHPAFRLPSMAGPREDH
jgi:ABC-type phosphate/phosphonate transport system substrate-binding protein